MTQQGDFFFGHPAYYDEFSHQYRYFDNDEIVHIPSIRPCPKCNQLPTKEGYDPCIGKIEGAISVCCGHGVENGYIAWEPDEYSMMDVIAPKWLVIILRRAGFGSFIEGRTPIEIIIRHKYLNYKTEGDDEEL